MKRSLAYPVFFFIFISHYSFAQTKWEPGYVITSSRDTLNGMIEYKNWKINPTEINFKSSDGDKITIYAQDDIDEFSVHHEKYIKAKVSVNISSDKLNELSQNPNPELVTRTVMLLSVYQGSKGLFMLHTSEDKDNLYIRINNEYVLLTQYTYRRYNSGGSDVIHQDHYKQQLVNYFSDCPGILPKINFVQYSSKSIGQLFKSYYSQCAKDTPVSTFVKEKQLFEFGVLAGATASKIKFKGDGTPDYFTGSMPVSVNFSGGAFANFILARTQRKFSVYGDLLFTSYKVENTQTSKVGFSENLIQTSTAQIGYGYLKLSTMARFSIPVSTSRVFFQGGITNGLAITETNSYTRTRTLNGVQSSTSSGKALSDVRKYEQGFVLGAGVVIQKFGVEIRYENSNGMSVINNLNSNVQRGYLLARYQL